jgi:hypothetical protein
LTVALLEFAGAHFTLSKPDKSGKTRLRTLLEIKAQTGVVAPELKALPEIPFGTTHIWQWFSDLDSKRQAGMAINALSWSDIEAYFRLRRIIPMQWELDAIVKLDNAFLASRYDNTTGRAKGASSLKRQMRGEAAK